MKTLIIDYGMGNLCSVLRAFEKCGADVGITTKPDELQYADNIVLPGVGAFPQAMNNLAKYGWKEELDELVIKEGIPILGICLGMQLFADCSSEGGENKGLGYIHGRIVRFDEQIGDRIPHVGWNDVVIENDSPLLKGISTGVNFYFVHSYHFEVDDVNDVLTSTPYCGGFVSAIGKNNIYGTQFHPEKSQKAGFQIIKNFIGL